MKFIAKRVLFAYFLATSLSAFAQINVPSFEIHPSTQKILLDGILNEDVWKNCQSCSNFCQTFPYDTGTAKSRTIVRILYDEHAIYVSAECYDSLLEKPFVVSSLKRDFSIVTSDGFVVTIDPFDDQTNGFSFGVTPQGAQREGAIESGGGFGVTTAWDNRWYSAVNTHKDKWVVEMKIPFKSIRYTPKIPYWRINFARQNLKINEMSTWVKVPRNFNISTLSYSGKMIWEKPPAKTPLNAAFIPYISYRNAHDFDNNKKVDEPKTGFDAKLTVKGSRNLDITVNPDYSQVDVDEQQINLTQFELFFPERRNFFIENSDLFANFGFRQIRPFFSRRIGLRSGQAIPIAGGARLSGKLNRNMRIGLMNLTTSEKVSDTNSTGRDYQNYTTAAFQHQVFKTSNIAGIFVNRQRIGEKHTAAIGSDFNRVAGLDFNLQSPSNRWRGKAFYHQSFDPGKSKSESFAHATWLRYSTKKWTTEWNHEFVGKNFNAETGYTPRIFQREYKSTPHRMSYWRFEPMVSRTFFPKSKLINNVMVQMYHSHYLDSVYSSTNYEIKPNFMFTFQNSASFFGSFNQIRNRLLFPFDPTGRNDTFIAAGVYDYYNINSGFQTNKRRLLSFYTEHNIGTFYGGPFLSNYAELSYRWQPWGIFSLKVNRNHINVPKVNLDEVIYLIGAKAELSFTSLIYFTTFIQYNTQIDNLNFYARLQWRFRPVSDLFIVYSDNYDIAFKKKNRGIALKLTWWLNT